jgi:MFS-type transporter involved in bile tolerance (Atg22 family)
VTEFGAVLLGTVIAGYLGETVGLRETLWLGVALALFAAVILALSPVRTVRRIPETAVEVVG